MVVVPVDKAVDPVHLEGEGGLVAMVAPADPDPVEAVVDHRWADPGAIASVRGRGQVLLHMPQQDPARHPCVPLVQAL